MALSHQSFPKITARFLQNLLDNEDFKGMREGYAGNCLNSEGMSITYLMQDKLFICLYTNLNFTHDILYNLRKTKLHVLFFLFTEMQTGDILNLYQFYKS